MATLTIKSGGSSVQVDITGKNLLSEVLRLIPKNELPQGASYLDFDFYIGGELIDLNEYDIDRCFNCDVSIVAHPHGEVLAIVSIVVSLISAAASFILTPKVPTQEQVTESPNNSVFGQTNTIRLDQLEPNIYGLQRSYPDLIVGEGGAWEYVDNKKIVKETFLIGIGDYDTQPPKYEETPLDDIAGQSWNYYYPNDLVPVVQGQFNSEAVDGQTLLGPNNEETEDTLNASTSSGLYETTGNGYVYMQVPIEPAWTAIFDRINETIDFTPYPCTFIVEAIPNIKYNFSGNAYNMYDNGNGTYGIDIDSEDAQPIVDFNGNIELTILPTAGYLDVTLPIPTNEVQISFEFLRGLKGTVEIVVYIYGTDDVNKRYEFTYTGDTINQRFYTEKIAVGNVLTGSDLEVRIIRLNDDRADGQNTIQVSQVATNEYRYNVNYGNRTILTTERQATISATRVRDSKINAIVTRKTVTYDGENVITNLTASRSFADAILHEYTQVFELSADDLPLDEMYQIDDRLSDGFNYFDFTFSDKEQSIKSILDTIANVARCKMSFTGQGYEIFRNEARLPAMQLDSRNISATSPEEISYRGVSLVSNDGVKLKYKNNDNNKFEYIYYVLINGVSTKCTYNGDGTYTPPAPKNPIEIDLTGSSTYDQADNRADLECRSLVFIQKTLSTTVLKDGNELSRGQLVRHSDYYQTDVASGEISAIDGNIFTTYNEIDLTGSDYYVTYTNEMGETLGAVPCTIIDLNHFMAEMPQAYLADGYNIQSGTRYVISTLEEHSNNLYEVSDKTPNQDGTVTLELIQYDERIYPEED